MYDLIVGFFEAIFKHGLSLSSAGAIVFLLLKQRKLKKRMRKYFPWMFEDDSEMKAYAGNQLIILENQSRIMQKLGVECVNGPLLKSSNQHQKNLNILSKLSQAVTNQVSQLRRKRMKKVIVIDAGHGGTDPGALGTNGKMEKTFVLLMALKIERLLLSNPAIKVILTRADDKFLELKERTDMANSLKADAFMSIHANSSSSNATGTETFYYNSNSKDMGSIIHKYLLEATGLKDRKLKKQNFYVIKNTKMPSALIEVGFINHLEDEAKLFDPAFQDKVALSMAKGICEFFGVAYEIEPTPVPEPVKPPVTGPYPTMEVTVNTIDPKSYTGYSIKGSTWIPSRPVCDILGATVDYNKGIVSINGAKLDTQLINGVGYVKSRDLSDITGARVFWDKSNPNKVLIYPKGA